jgi:hypothetical protein
MLRVGYTLQVKLFGPLWSSRLYQSATEVDILPYFLTYQHTHTQSDSIPKYMPLWSLDISVSAVTRLRAGQVTNRGWIFSRVKKVTSSPNLLD